MLEALALAIGVVVSGQAAPSVEIVRHQVPDGLPFDLVLNADQGSGHASVRVPPGARELELPARGDLRVLGCRAEGVWCASTRLGSTGAALRLDVFRSASARARVRVPPGSVGPRQIHVQGHVLLGGAEKPITFSEVRPLDLRGDVALVLPRAPVDLRFVAEGYAPVYRLGIDARRPVDLGTLGFSLGASIAGRVRDVNGATLDGVAVSLYPAGAMATRSDGKEQEATLRSATTSSGGFFQFAGVEQGRYWVEFWSRDHSSTEAFVEVAADTEQFLDEIWLEPFRRVDVRVDPPTDPTGATWRVGLTNLRDLRRARVQSAAAWAGASREGVASFARVSAGPQQVEVATHDGTRLLLVTRELPPYPEPGIAVEVPSVRVDGRVRRGASPVRDARVVVREPGGGIASFRSDESGEFGGPFAIPAEGELRVTVTESEDTEPQELGFDDAKIEDGRLSLDVDLGALSLAGRVIDERDAPVRDALLSASRAELSGGDFHTARSDASGDFLFSGLREGRYLVSASARGVGSAGPEEVQVRGNEHVVIRLESGQEVSGILLSAIGAPVAGARVELATATGFRGVASTDENGRFRTKVLPVSARSAVVTVWAPSLMLWSGCVFLSPDQDLKVVLPPTPTGTLHVEPFPVPGKVKAVIVTDGGGFLRRGDLERWKALQGLQNLDFHSGASVDVSGLAPGQYSIATWPSFDEGGLAAATCSSSVAGLVSSGVLAPGGTLSLSGAKP